MKQQILFATLALVCVVSLGQAAKPEIQHVMIEPATEDTPAATLPPSLRWPTAA